MSQSKTKVLAIYRDFLLRERGTPIRVKSILAEISMDSDIQLHTATQDQELPFSSKHLKIGRRNISNIFHLIKYIKRNKIEVVIFHTISAGYYMPFLGVANPFVGRLLEMHGFPEEEAVLYGEKSYCKYWRRKLFYKLMFKMSNVITVCSETAREVLLKSNPNTYTVYGGVDVAKFSRPQQKKKEGRFVGKKIVIGYSGNARVWQGLDFLLETFSELLKIDSHFFLYLLISEKREKINILNFKNIKLFPPTTHDGAAEFIMQCDVLVVPRGNSVVNRLSFPSKLMEYLATGIPVVGSRTSDIHRIIKHQKDGLLFNPGDKEEFINCLLQLRDPKMRKKIGERGAETAASYSWGRQGILFCNIIKDNFHN